MFRRKLVPIIIFFLALTQIAQAAETKLTLDEAIAIALRDNRDVLLDSAEVEKAAAKIREAWSSVIPSLNVTAQRAVTQNLANKPYTTNYIQAELKQVLFAGGKYINTIKYNEFDKQVKEALLDKTKLELALSVKTAFSTLLLAKDFSEMNKRMLENAVSHLQLAKERYKNGEASESDILNAQSYLSNTQQNYDESLNQVEANQALLRNLLYFNDTVTIIPDAQFAYEPQEIAYDRSLLAALEKRPEIRQYEAQEKANKKAVSIQRAGYLPTVYATWDSYSGDRFIIETGGAGGKWKNYNVYGITLTWPLFDGFSTKSKIEQAMVDLKEAQILKQKAVKDIALELKNAYLSLKNSISSIDATESDLVFYRQNLATAKQRFKEGILSELDLDDAELKYRIASFNKEQALYDYIIARSTFDKATGGI